MGNRKTKLLRAQMNFLHHRRWYQSVSKSVEPDETDWKFAAKIRSEDDVYPVSVADWFMDEVCKGGAGWGLLGQRRRNSGLWWQKPGISFRREGGGWAVSVGGRVDEVCGKRRWNLKDESMSETGEDSDNKAVTITSLMLSLVFPQLNTSLLFPIKRTLPDF